MVDTSTVALGGPERNQSCSAQVCYSRAYRVPACRARVYSARACTARVGIQSCKAPNGRFQSYTQAGRVPTCKVPVCTVRAYKARAYKARAYKVRVCIQLCEAPAYRGLACSLVRRVLAILQDTLLRLWIILIRNQWVHESVIFRLIVYLHRWLQPYIRVQDRTNRWPFVYARLEGQRGRSQSLPYRHCSLCDHGDRICRSHHSGKSKVPQDPVEGKKVIKHTNVKET